MSKRHADFAYREESLPYTVPYEARAEELLNILLVEDDYSDALLTIQRINATKIPYNLGRTTHGDDVLPYLASCETSTLPDILLLDMGLPGFDGFDILASLSNAPAIIRAIPIAIITGQPDFGNLPASYKDLPIYGCLPKPLSVGDIGGILSKVTKSRD